MGGKLDAPAFLLRMMLARVPDLDRWEQDRGHPVLEQIEQVRAFDRLLSPTRMKRRVFNLNI